MMPQFGRMFALREQMVTRCCWISECAPMAIRLIGSIGMVCGLIVLNQYIKQEIMLDFLQKVALI